jgi:hypothetical protein
MYPDRVCNLRGASRVTAVSVLRWSRGSNIHTYYVYAICVVCYIALLCSVGHSIIAIYISSALGRKLLAEME